MTNGNSRFDLSDFFSETDILCHTPLTERDAVLLELLRLLAINHGIGNVQTAFDAVLAREQSQSTLLAPGLAMPHARLDGLARPFIAIATSPAGIRFPDHNTLVHLLLLVLVPKDQPALYLQILRATAGIAQKPDTPAMVAALPTATEVRRFFASGGMVLPPHVCAGDIMAVDPVTLRDTDTLKAAIDIFTHLNLTEVPVVDKDGDLAGVVTAHALMRVCLPDYLLWMDDLSPLINFEPFTNVLLKESSTWLTEIISTDCTTVQDDAPAIQAAAEITRSKAAQCFVLHGKKLVGVIGLSRFMHKVMRE
jgi:mannitol/fructose-specific phosphotransferase system IIA component (Ntr-type)/CBS domain-containing protein